MSVRTVMTLGTIPFRAGEIDLQGWRRSDSWRHIFTPVLGGGSAHHFGGDEATELELDGVVFPGVFGTADAADQIRRLAATGEKQTLIRGDGVDLGEYYVINISEDNRPLRDTGQGRQVAYSLRLRRDDNGSS